MAAGVAVISIGGRMRSCGRRGLWVAAGYELKDRGQYRRSNRGEREGTKGSADADTSIEDCPLDQLGA